MCIIGNDVVSLFPSLDSKDIGKIVREEVMRSSIEIDRFSTRLGLRYISMNEYTSDLEEIRKLLPIRVVKCKWVNSKEALEGHRTCSRDRHTGDF